MIEMQKYKLQCFRGVKEKTFEFKSFNDECAKKDAKALAVGYDFYNLTNSNGVCLVNMGRTDRLIDMFMGGI